MDGLIPLKDEIWERLEQRSTAVMRSGLSEDVLEAFRWGGGRRWETAVRLGGVCVKERDHDHVQPAEHRWADSAVDAPWWPLKCAHVCVSV